MRWFRFAFLLILIMVVQASLMDKIEITELGIKPDLLLIFLVFYAIYSGITEAMITSFVIGLGADIIGPSMGPQIMSFTIFGVAVAYLNRVIAIRKMPYHGAAIFAVGILTGLLAYLLGRIFSGLQPDPDILTIVFFNSLYSGLVGPFLFLPCAWWMRIQTQKFTRH
ncbi:MAG: rod shape-determining protein MreD [Planctomycetota bacterium]